MCAHGALAANSTSKLMVQNLLQLSMCFFMHVSEMEHSSSAITAYLQPPLHLMTESDNYMHTMADIVFPLVDIIYHYIDYLPLEIIILLYHDNRVYLRHDQLTYYTVVFHHASDGRCFC